LEEETAIEEPREDFNFSKSSHTSSMLRKHSPFKSKKRLTMLVSHPLTCDRGRRTSSSAN